MAQAHSTPIEFWPTPEGSTQVGDSGLRGREGDGLGFPGAIFLACREARDPPRLHPDLPIGFPTSPAVGEGGIGGQLLQPQEALRHLGGGSGRVAVVGHGDRLRSGSYSPFGRGPHLKWQAPSGALRAPLGAIRG